MAGPEFSAQALLSIFKETGASEEEAMERVDFFRVMFSKRVARIALTVVRHRKGIRK